MGDLAMRQRLPSLNWLRAFEGAARHLSFTGAARELHMTQAGISLQVKHLEQYLGEPLFHRFARSLQLTDAGEAYLCIVREVFERLDEGTEEIFHRPGDGPTTIRVNVAFASLWLAPRIENFLAENPTPGLRLTAAVHPVDGDWDGVDMEIRYGTGKWPGFRSNRLTWDALFPVCSPALLGGPGALRQPNDLAHLLLLHVIGNQQGWAAWLAAAGVADVSAGQGLQFDTSIVALEMAAAGVGVALGHSSFVGGYFASGRLAAPFDICIPTNGAFYLVAPEGRPLHAEAKRFRDWIVPEAESAREAINAQLPRLTLARLEGQSGEPARTDLSPVNSSRFG
jgi:LysR family glycine cleavage system transcriptional activator